MVPREPNTAPISRVPGIVALSVTLVVLALLVRYANGWQVDNRIEAWATATGADAGYELLNDRFGGDAVVLVRLDQLDLASEPHARFVAGVPGRMRALAAVREVFDPLSLPAAGSGSLGARLARVAETGVAGALDAVVAAGAPRIDYLLLIHPSARSEAFAALAAGVEALRGDARALGLRVRAAGHPLVASGLDDESRRVDLVFGPLLVLVALGACALFLRSLPLALATMLPAVLASASLRAGLRAAGIDANMILVVGAPLVFVVLVASVLHLTLRFSRFVTEGTPPAEAATRARAETGGAALLAAATTAVGFGVFFVSDVRAVRHLGLAVGSVVSIAVPFAYWVVPWLLPAALGEQRWRAALAAHARHDGGAGPQPGGKSARRRSGRHWRTLAVSAARHRGAVLAVAAAGIVAGALAPLHMRVSTDAIDYFPEGHALRREFSALERDGASLSTVDVLYRRPAGAAFDDAWSEALQRAVEQLEGVAGTFGPVDVSRDVDAATPAPLRALARQAAWRTAGRVDAGGELARLTVRAQAADLASVMALARRVTAVIEAHTRGGAASDVWVASSMIRLAALHDALVGTLAKSLVLTGGVALAAFFCAVRRARERAAALVANVLPVALALAGARAFGLALDAATVMVASVVMGLAVDTTFHLLLAARAQPWSTSASAFTHRRRTLAAFVKVGDAAFASALVLVAGFGALCLADFAPTAHFGLASALGVAAAFVADMVVVPAVLLGSGAAARARA
ncbi:MAG: MMPL family transporter [Planctomycetota bacterium]